MGNWEGIVGKKLEPCITGLKKKQSIPSNCNKYSLVSYIANGNVNLLVVP